MRRSFEDLQRRFGLREMRGISDADGEGYLYAYVDSDGWKIGMSNNFVRRQEEWDKDCPSPWRIWLPPIQVANRRRAETLAHLLLEMECVDRPRIYCQNCRPTSAHRKIRFLWTFARRLDHDRLSNLFKGCCFVKVDNSIKFVSSLVVNLESGKPSRYEPAEQVLYTTLSAYLAETTGDSTYTAAATLSAQWIQNLQISSSGIVLDGVSGADCTCTAASWLFTYNSGKYIEGLSVLKDVTGAAIWKSLMTNITAAAVKSPVWQGSNGIITEGASKTSDNDGVGFKAQRITYTDILNATFRHPDIRGRPDVLMCRHRRRLNVRMSRHRYNIQIPPPFALLR
ncbi:glycosyl hydrolase family 76-domain-containing protein [Lentinula edodes]|nr:glycosyl hydrolase family 76-domain-containing protein [Lentinula edodes]